jgi:uncharacterized protein YoxC
MKKPAETIEEKLQKLERIKEITKKMNTLREEIKNKDKEIERKDEEIEKLNKIILELAEKIREEEHDANEVDRKRFDYLNQEKVKDLKNQLMAA